MTIGTTNQDKPFEQGEHIDFCDSYYEVLENHGNSGAVRELGEDGLRISPFYWTFQNEVCRRIEKQPA